MERRREIERERAQERAEEAARGRAEQRRAAQARDAGQRSAPAAPGGGGAREIVGSVSSGAYAAQVRAILQARANALGLEDVRGVVGVSFSVGPSGRLVSHAISRPSGNFAIDQAIRSLLASVAFPPPPGGGFTGNVTVRVE